MTTLTPHFHKDLIIAFALGYSIQYLCPTKGYWKDAPNPTWKLTTQYRVTPRIVHNFGEIKTLLGK